MEKSNKKAYLLSTGSFLTLIALAADKNLNNKKKWEDKACNFKESNLLKKLLLVVYPSDGLLENYDERKAGTSVGDLKRCNQKDGKYYPFKVIKPYINKYIKTEYPIFYNNMFDFIENTLSVTVVKEFVIPAIVKIFESRNEKIDFWYQGEISTVAKTDIDIPAFLLGAWIYCIQNYTNNTDFICAATQKELNEEFQGAVGLTYIEFSKKEITDGKTELIEDKHVEEEVIVEETPIEVVEPTKDDREEHVNQMAHIGFVFNGPVSGGNFANGNIYVGKEEKKDE